MPRKKRQPGETNRDVARRYYGHSHWCVVCDMALVTSGGVCPVCHHKDGSESERVRDSRRRD